MTLQHNQAHNLTQILTGVKSWVRLASISQGDSVPLDGEILNLFGFRTRHSVRRLHPASQFVVYGFSVMQECAKLRAKQCATPCHAVLAHRLDA